MYQTRAINKCAPSGQRQQQQDKAAPGSRPQRSHGDDRPLEIPISRRPTHLLAETPSSAPRDPRFDSRCSGSNDVRHFLRNYSFVDDLRAQELRQLQGALKKEANPEKKEAIKRTANSIRNKIVDNQSKNQRLEVASRLKPRRADGKTSRRAVNNSDIKKSLLVQKFKQLKETGKLSKYLERKRKKLIKRDRQI